MKLPHLPRLHFQLGSVDRLTLQTGLELAAGAVLVVLLHRWVLL